MDLDRKSLPFGRRPALILVDLMLGFTDPACPLGSESSAVIEANLALLAAMRSRGLPIFFTRVIYDSDNQARAFRAHVPALNLLICDGPWVAIDPRLGRRDTEALINKHHPSAFFETDLATQLRALDVDCLIVTGLTTSGCVRASAVDGLQYGWPVFVPEEACGDRNLDAHRANLFDLNAKYADVLPLKDVLVALETLV
jgi:maleamate amidohydrolase